MRDSVTGDNSLVVSQTGSIPELTVQSGVHPPVRYRFDRDTVSIGRAPARTAVDRPGRLRGAMQPRTKEALGP